MQFKGTVSIEKRCSDFVLLYCQCIIIEKFPEKNCNIILSFYCSPKWEIATGLKLFGLPTESLTAPVLQIDFLILEHLEVCWGQFRYYTHIIHTTSSSWSGVKVLNSPNGANPEAHSVNVQDFDFLMERFCQDTQKKKKKFRHTSCCLILYKVKVIKGKFNCWTIVCSN